MANFETCCTIGNNFKRYGILQLNKSTSTRLFYCFLISIFLTRTNIRTFGIKVIVPSDTQFREVLNFIHQILLLLCPIFNVFAISIPYAYLPFIQFDLIC